MPERDTLSTVPMSATTETTTKRERAEMPSRNLRISSLPVKVVDRWLMVPSSAK